MHICILLYIHVTVLYYSLASFQKINVNVNVAETIQKAYLLKEVHLSVTLA